MALAHGLQSLRKTLRPSKTVIDIELIELVRGDESDAMRPPVSLLEVSRSHQRRSGSLLGLFYTQFGA